MMFKQKNNYEMNPIPHPNKNPMVGAQHARLRRAPLEPRGDVLTGKPRQRAAGMDGQNSQVGFCSDGGWCINAGIPKMLGL